MSKDSRNIAKRRLPQAFNPVCVVCCVRGEWDLRSASASTDAAAVTAITDAQGCIGFSKRCHVCILSTRYHAELSQTKKHLISTRDIWRVFRVNTPVQKVVAQSIDIPEAMLGQACRAPYLYWGETRHRVCELIYKVT